MTGAILATDDAGSSAAFLIFVGVVAVAAIVTGAVLINRDFARRGDDPAKAILAWILFWPAGVYLWLKERKKPVVS